MMRMNTSLAVALSIVGAAGLAGPAHGQADFEGIWVPDNLPGLGGPLPDSEIKLTPAGQGESERFSAENDSMFQCVMPGIPKGFVDPYPIEIIQQDHQIVILYEYFHQVRRVFMDGREAPEYWPTSLGGRSTGHWEGETLVVRTTHLSPDNDLDSRGRPFSGAEDTHVIERYERSGDELTLTAEIYDPTYYEEPPTVTRRWKFTPDGEIWEYECDPEFGTVD